MNAAGRYGRGDACDAFGTHWPACDYGPAHHVKAVSAMTQEEARAEMHYLVSDCGGGEAPWTEEETERFAEISARF